MTSAICVSPAWLGPPSPDKPRCGNGHRERYMTEYRTAPRWRCRKCGASVAEGDWIAGHEASPRFLRWQQRLDREMAEDARSRFCGRDWMLTKYSDDPAIRDLQMWNGYKNDLWAELVINEAWWQWRWIDRYA